ncbi:MAG: hypothetical protein CMP91_11605 [Gammaproteobacteria bacterium]|nr:hypothetical protein [Gammaproteobacteria bacterium]|tara:strand:- start:61691 stop:62920 length:1230 start_codon:yes stop_codon:yes gene_type:complete
MQEKGALTSFSNEFRDRAMEYRYRVSSRSETVQQLRVSLLVSAVIFALLIVLDYRLVGMNLNFYALVGLRTIAILACLALIVALSRSPKLADRSTLLNIVCFIMVTAMILVIPLRPVTESSQLTAAVILSFAIYLFFPNRIAWVVALNVYLAVGFLLALIFWSTVSSSMIFGAAMVLLFQNAVGLVILRRLSALQRRQFALLAMERQTNKLMQQEIESRKDLEAQLRQQAQKDHLTGLNNRRWFLELAEQELRHCRRRQEPLSLCMVDLDHFKTVNDRFGHAVGDRVLVQIAGLCQEVLRDSDIIGRYGGEEFVLALPGTDANAAFEVAERLRLRILHFTFLELPEPLQLSITAGIAEVTAEDEDPGSALERADLALYAGKARGRNTVILENELQNEHGNRRQAQSRKI